VHSPFWIACAWQHKGQSRLWIVEPLFCPINAQQFHRNGRQLHHQVVCISKPCRGQDAPDPMSVLNSEWKMLMAWACRSTVVMTSAAQCAAGSVVVPNPPSIYSGKQLKCCHALSLVLFGTVDPACGLGLTADIDQIRGLCRDALTLYQLRMLTTAFRVSLALLAAQQLFFHRCAARVHLGMMEGKLRAPSVLACTLISFAALLTKEAKGLQSARTNKGCRHKAGCHRQGG